MIERDGRFQATREVGLNMKAPKTSGIARIILGSTILCTGLLSLPGITRAESPGRPQKHLDSFFIISSVDAQKQQIVLKLPTEVTEVVEATGATTFRDEKGKSLKFEELRAGDTVYATVIQNAKGTLTVTNIRRGPMTVEELHRRYLLED